MEIKAYCVKIVIALLVLSNLCIGAVLVGHISRANQREARSSEQIAELNRKNQEMQAKMNERPTPAEAAPPNIAGVYHWYNQSYGRVQFLDLRSDGAGKFNDAVSGGRLKPADWKLNPDSTVSIAQHGTFKIEGDDLIDERGNRWLRER